MYSACCLRYNQATCMWLQSSYPEIASFTKMTVYLPSSPPLASDMPQKWKGSHEAQHSFESYDVLAIKSLVETLVTIVYYTIQFTQIVAEIRRPSNYMHVLIGPLYSNLQHQLQMLLQLYP